MEHMHFVVYRCMFSFSECNLRGYSKNTAYILAQIKAMLVGILAFVALAEDTPLCPDTTDRPLVLQPDWGNKKVNLNLLNWAKEPLTATVLEPGAKEERVCVDRVCDGMFFSGDQHALAESGFEDNEETPRPRTDSRKFEGTTRKKNQGFFFLLQKASQFVPI